MAPPLQTDQQHLSELTKAHKQGLTPGINRHMHTLRDEDTHMDEDIYAHTQQ